MPYFPFHWPICQRKPIQTRTSPTRYAYFFPFYVSYNAKIIKICPILNYVVVHNLKIKNIFPLTNNCLNAVLDISHLKQSLGSFLAPMTSSLNIFKLGNLSPLKLPWALCFLSKLTAFSWFSPHRLPPELLTSLLPGLLSYSFFTL